MKIEMHTHTQETSPCSNVSAERIIKAYKNAGYDAIVITDHFNDNVLCYFEGNPKEKVTRFLRGYECALEAGAKYDFKVFFGIETCLFGGPEDFLLYGIDTDFLYEYPKFYNMKQKDAYKVCKAYGALFYQAHPCRSYCKPQDARYLDGVEAYNGNPRQINHNHKTLQWAKQYPHLRYSSGSDFHQIEDVGSGGIITPDGILNSKDLADYMRDHPVKLIQESIGRD